MNGVSLGSFNYFQWHPHTSKKKISNGTLVRESPLLERNSGDGQMN